MTEQIQTISLSEIQENPRNPRKDFDEAGIQELAENIDAIGLLQPIRVRPIDDMFQIVHGHRRYRAVKILEWETIPSIITQLSDQKAFEISLSENILRANLSPVEEAEGFRRLIDEFGYTQQEVAATFGKTQTFVHYRLALLKLPESIQEKIMTRVINQSHGELLAKIDDPELQIKLADEIEQNGLSVRELERKIKKLSTPEENVEQPSWRDDASPGLIKVVEGNVFSKEVARALAKYDHDAQDAIARQIEAMVERPPNRTLIEGIRKAEGVPERFQQWVDKQVSAAHDETPAEPSVESTETQPDDVVASDEQVQQPEEETILATVEDGESESPTGETVELDDDAEPQLYCDEHFRSLDDIREYIGKNVKVVVSVGKRGANTENRGKILDVVNLMGTYMLDFIDENGEKTKVSTGTTDHTISDIGIIEIQEVEAFEAITEETADVEADKGTVDEVSEEQEWQKFGEYYRWIENYASERASQEDTFSVSKICDLLDTLTRKLKDALEDLDDSA